MRTSSFRGPVDGRSLPTSEWQHCVDRLFTGIVVAGCGLICMVQMKNKHERSMPVWSPRCGETCKLGSRGLVADGFKCGPHGDKKGKTKSWTWSRCRVVANNRSLHAGFGWFTPQNQHRVGTTWLPSQEELGAEVKDWIGDQRGGREEMEANKNSSQDLAYIPKQLSKNSTQTCKDHVITADLLNVGTS
jgi:hypothetical protein